MKKLGLIMGLSAMALSAGLTTNQVRSFGSSAQSANEVANQKTDNMPVNNQNLQNEPTERIAYQERHTSSGSRYFQDYGISPKDYGMNYVKRGTHKRTNV